MFYSQEKYPPAKYINITSRLIKTNHNQLKIKKCSISMMTSHIKRKLKHLMPKVSGVESSWVSNMWWKNLIIFTAVEVPSVSSNNEEPQVGKTHLKSAKCRVSGRSGSSPISTHVFFSYQATSGNQPTGRYTQLHLLTKPPNWWQEKKIFNLIEQQKFYCLNMYFTGSCDVHWFKMTS